MLVKCSVKFCDYLYCPLLIYLLRLVLEGDCDWIESSLSWFLRLVLFLLGLVLLLGLLLLGLELLRPVLLLQDGISIAILDESIESVLDLLYLLLLLLLELLVKGSHISGSSLLLDILKPPQCFKILLLGHLPSKDISHDLLLILLHGIQRLA